MKAFYKQNRKDIQHKKIVISERFCDENGKAIVWEMKPLMQEVMVLAESVVFPDLNSIKLQNSYHVAGKEALLLEMLTPGEYQKLKTTVEQLL